MALSSSSGPTMCSGAPPRIELGGAARSIGCRVLRAGALVVAFANGSIVSQDSPRPVTDAAAPGVAPAAPSNEETPEEKLRRLRLRQIAEGYRANKATFTVGMWRVETRQGTAATMEDAFAGNWKAQGPRPFEATYVLRDDAVVCRTRADDTNFARKGNIVLRQSGNSATLYRLPNYRAGDDPNPIVPTQDLAAVIAAGATKTSQETIVRDDVEYILLRQRGVSGQDLDFYVDRRHGYLPMIVDAFQTKSVEHVWRERVLEVRQEGTTWVPIRTITALRGTLPGGESARTVSAWESRVAAIDLARRPADADLTIEVPTTAQFIIDGDSNSAKSLFMGKPGPIRLSVDDLEGLHRQLQEVSTERKREQETK